MKEQLMTDERERSETHIAQALTDLRQQPSAGLYRRLEGIPGYRPRHQARLVWVTAAALLMTAVFWVSPVVRATIDEVVERVGQVYLTVADKLPYRDGATTVEPVTMSLEEAQAAVSFNFGVPAVLPPGFVPDRVAVWMPNETAGQVVMMTWRRPGGGLLELGVHAYNESEPIHTVVGLASIETVQVNGHDAALVRGGWDSDTGRWGYQDQTVTLIWQAGGVQYSLLAHPELGSVDELVLIAESIE